MAAVEALVHDLGRRLRAQAQTQDEGGAVITPVELYVLCAVSEGCGVERNLKS